MPSDGDLVIRLVVAALLGSAIGLERELSGQSAGLRTQMTIALGAALFAIASAYSFTEFIRPRAETNYQVDVTRIASNIVVGVGFLGGGAILKHGATVSGLTTAASIWVTAAVGLSVGLGGFMPATVTTVLLLLVLVALRGPRRWLRQRAESRQSVVIRLAPGTGAGEVVTALFQVPGIDVKSVSLSDQSPDGVVISAEIKGRNLSARMGPLADRDDVTDVDIGD